MPFRTLPGPLAGLGAGAEGPLLDPLEPPPPPLIPSALPCFTGLLPVLLVGLLLLFAVVDPFVLGAPEVGLSARSPNIIFTTPFSVGSGLPGAELPLRGVIPGEGVRT